MPKFDFSRPASSIRGCYTYLRVNDGPAAIAFYEKAFGAKENYRLVEPSGRLGHAEMSFGATTVMLSAAYPEYDIHDPIALGGTSVTIHLHVDDADSLGARAVAAGGKMIMPPTDQFQGERACKVRCPFGHDWLIGHEIEKVDPAEMQRRFTALMGGSSL